LRDALIPDQVTADVFTVRSPMPTELAFQATQTVEPGDLTTIGGVLVQPYERIRVLAYCPFDATGGVRVLLTHVVDGSAAGTLVRFVLLPGSQFNHVYEIPGETLALSAQSTTDSSTSVTVYIWGFGAGNGAPIVTT
jgi:hypothetical protein